MKLWNLRLFESMARLVCCIFLTVAYFSSGISGLAAPEEHPDMFKFSPSIRIANASEIFPDNYDKTAYPEPSDGRPMTIYVQFSLANVVAVDETLGFVRYQTYLSLYWRDERLIVPKLPPGSNATSIQLDTSLQERLWVPDVMVYNLEDMQTVDLVGRLGLLRLLTNGYIQYGIYARLSVACQMDFSTYPFDTQECYLKFGSYSQEREQMLYKWSPTYSKLFSKDRLELQTYLISIKRSGPEVGCSVSSDGDEFCFSNVVVNVSLQRRKSLFVWHIFVPCILLVTTSWLSLLLPPDIIPGRMVLCITSLLAMLTLFTSSLKTMGVSYLRASDVWYVACLLFDFLIILEYAVLLWLQRGREEREAKWGQVQPFPATDGSKPTRASPSKRKFEKREPKSAASSLWMDLQEPAYMDEISRWILAVFFIIFTIIFWTYYAASKHEED